MSEDCEIRRIMFVGAQQAGKTTMMCGWFHLAKSVYAADPIMEYEQTAQLLETYQRYIDAAVVDPTNRGEVTRSRFHCQHQHHKFDLELIDYSGEDISSSASKFLHSADGESLNPLEAGFVSDLENADWIIMVHDPQSIAEGTAAQVVDSLWLAKVLPRLLFAGGDGTIANATIYLSRGDQASQDVIDQAESSLREAIQSSNLATLPIKCGNAKVWEQKEQAAPERHFAQFFAQTMLSVLNRPGAVVLPKLKQQRVGRWAYVFAVVAAILFASIWMYLEKPTPQDDPKWQGLIAELDNLEDGANNSIDYTKAQKLVVELDRVESRFKTDFPSIDSPEVSGRIEDLRADLNAIEKPSGSEKIASAIVELRKLHGPNLTAFYVGLAELAKKERMNDVAWQKDARDEWEVIEKFCEQVSGGVPVQLAHSSFKGPYWWTSTIGEDDLKLEIWLAEPGDPQPFDADTDELASLGTDIKGSVQSGDEYSVRWAGAVAEQSSEKNLVVNIKFDTQVWVRLYSYDFDNETLEFVKVPRDGPLGLDWFDRSQSVRVSDDAYNLIVRISTELKVPAAIQEAFKN
ncbi:hypothetical protein CA13_21010 [Planctomycetes bacterium CA13]|uniref:Uncharacterized protein n=1 Tax=Novipirellula herctigrandis TaxID=2527986 RepID=A0A5C5Z0X0_9BACT|nr:hypothetical protein CA13_21010 [Planctomycetes bacterium CA13]